MIRIPIWVNLTVAVILLTAYARFITIWFKFFVELYCAALFSFTWEGIKKSFKEAFAGFTIIPLCDYLGDFGATIKKVHDFFSVFGSDDNASNNGPDWGYAGGETADDEEAKAHKEEAAKKAAEFARMFKSFMKNGTAST